MVVLSREIYTALKVALGVIISSGTVLSHDLICDRFPDIDFNTIHSLYSQLLVREAKKKKTPLDLPTALAAPSSSGGNEKVTLCSLAASTSTSPYKLARTYLAEVAHIEYSDFLNNPNLIEDENIRFDLLGCIADDPMCSTIVDIRKACTGRDFEEYLEYRLLDLNICFETENNLRLQGKPKTPDIVLLIPMTLDLGDEKSCLINWIDSKGMFADKGTFLEHEQQLRGYVNRYGHGMVIYWYGYVDDIPVVDNIHISDHFPRVWRFPTGEIAVPGGAAISTADTEVERGRLSSSADNEVLINGLFALSSATGFGL